MKTVGDSTETRLVQLLLQGATVLSELPGIVLLIGGWSGVAGCYSFILTDTATTNTEAVI